MHAIYRPCLCVLFVIRCFSLAWAEQKLSPSRTEYDKFLQTYTAKPQA